MMIIKLLKSCAFFPSLLVLSFAGCATLKSSHAPVSQLNVRDEVLSLHNTLRARHHAAPLTWDDALASYAANYAKNCEFKHSKGPYGENLAAGYPSARIGVNTWYAERAYYNYQHPSFSTRTGHFTQLVWKSSQKLGCAYVVCNGLNGTPGKFLVCEYSPAGNVLGEKYFSQNVTA